MTVDAAQAAIANFCNKVVAMQCAEIETEFSADKAVADELKKRLRQTMWDQKEVLFGKLRRIEREETHRDPVG